MESWAWNRFTGKTKRKLRKVKNSHPQLTQFQKIQNILRKTRAYNEQNWRKVFLTMRRIGPKKDRLTLIHRYITQHKQNKQNNVSHANDSEIRNISNHQKTLLNMIYRTQAQGVKIQKPFKITKKSPNSHAKTRFWQSLNSYMRLKKQKQHLDVTSWFQHVEYLMKMDDMTLLTNHSELLTAFFRFRYPWALDTMRMNASQIACLFRYCMLIDISAFHLFRLFLKSIPKDDEKTYKNENVIAVKVGKFSSLLNICLMMVTSRNNKTTWKKISDLVHSIQKTTSSNWKKTVFLLIKWLLSFIKDMKMFKTHFNLHKMMINFQSNDSRTILGQMERFCMNCPVLTLRNEPSKIVCPTVINYDDALGVFSDAILRSCVQNVLDNDDNFASQVSTFESFTAHQSNRVWNVFDSERRVPVNVIESIRFFTNSNQPYSRQVVDNLNLQKLRNLPLSTNSNRQLRNRIIQSLQPST